jgi:hypothetical protein
MVLNKVVNYVKQDLMPNFDFDAFNSDGEDVIDSVDPIEEQPEA